MTLSPGVAAVAERGRTSRLFTTRDANDRPALERGQRLRQYQLGLQEVRRRGRRGALDESGKSDSGIYRDHYSSRRRDGGRLATSTDGFRRLQRQALQGGSSTTGNNRRSLWRDFAKPGTRHPRGAYGSAVDGRGAPLRDGVRREFQRRRRVTIKLSGPDGAVLGTARSTRKGRAMRCKPPWSSLGT